MGALYAHREIFYLLKTLYGYTYAFRKTLIYLYAYKCLGDTIAKVTVERATKVGRLEDIAIFKRERTQRGGAG